MTYEILNGAREVLNNPALQLGDIVDWGFQPIEALGGEIAVYVPNPGVHILVDPTADQR